MKPWLSEPRGRQLEAFLGVWGIKTSNIETTNDLIADACTLYSIPIAVGMSVESLADEINALGRKERKARAEANIGFFTDRQPTTAKTEQPITDEALEKMMADSKPQMIDGASMDCIGELDIDPAKLLQKVVSAVISAGQGHILYEFPEVLAFFGSRIPSREELAGHTGVDERMFEAKARWPNVKPEFRS
jgi:hypothetical protein